MRCYATSDDLDWSLELGFEAFKVSNPVHYDQGLEGLNALEEKIGAARKTVGDAAELAFNPVMGFNVDFTVRLAERLRQFDLRWLEEPLPPWDLEGQIALRERIPYMPLATGEHHHGRHAHRQLVEHRAVDILQPDMKWCGGLTEALKIYTIAEGGRDSDRPPLWRQHPLGPALQHRDARGADRRVLDGLGPWRPPR